MSGDDEPERWKTLSKYFSRLIFATAETAKCETAKKRFKSENHNEHELTIPLAICFCLFTEKCFYCCTMRFIIPLKSLANHMERRKWHISKRKFIFISSYLYKYKFRPFHSVSAFNPFLASHLSGDIIIVLFQ